MISESTLDWVELSDSDQRRWAEKYLTKKGLLFRAATPYNGHTPLRLTVQWPPLEHTADITDPTTLDRKMRGAWAQQKRRLKSESHKPYNFFMKKDVEKALGNLKRRTKKAMNHALEELILEDCDLATKYKDLLREESRQYREQYHKKGQIRLERMNNERNRKDLTHQKKVSEEQWRIIKNLIHLIAKYESSSPNGHRPDLTPAEAAASNKREEELLNFYKREIDANVDFPIPREGPTNC